MNYRTSSMFCLLTTSLYINPAFSEIEDIAKARTLIYEVADTICGQMIYDGNKHSEELQAEASLKVNNLVKQLADMGGTVRGEISRSGYYGVLQEQLGSTIKNTQDCRSRVWSDLRDMIVDKTIVLPKMPTGTDVHVEGECNQTVTGSTDVTLSSTSCIKK